MIFISVSIVVGKGSLLWFCVWCYLGIWSYLLIWWIDLILIVVLSFFVVWEVEVCVYCELIFLMVVFLRWMIGFVGVYVVLSFDVVVGVGVVVFVVVVVFFLICWVFWFWSSCWYLWLDGVEVLWFYLVEKRCFLSVFLLVEV